MWPLDEEVSFWLERVFEERDEKYGNNRSGGRQESSDMMSNDLAEGRGR